MERASLSYNKRHTPRKYDQTIQKLKNHFHSNGITCRYRFTNCVCTWEASFFTFSKCDEENPNFHPKTSILYVLCGDDNLPNYFPYFFPATFCIRWGFSISFHINSNSSFLVSSDLFTFWCFNSYWNVLYSNNNNFMPTPHILCVCVCFAYYEIGRNIVVIYLWRHSIECFFGGKMKISDIE